MAIFQPKLRSLILIISSFVILVSGLALLGWLTRTTFLLEVVPGLAPMQFNTAIGLLVSSASLISHVCGSSKLLRPLNYALIGLGGTTLFEWISGRRLFIDSLFFQGNISNLNSPLVGRMSPVTAAAFFLLGFCLLALSGRGRQKHKSTLLAGAFTVVVLVCSCTFLSSLLRSDLIYAGLKFNQVALHTSLCLILLGFGGGAINWNSALKIGHRMHCLVATTVTALMMATIVWSLADLSQENRQARVTTVERMDGAKSHFETLIQQDSRALRRMASRMGGGLELKKDSWLRDATQYVSDCSEFETVGYVDSNFKLRWNAPDRPHRIFTDPDAISVKRLKQAMERARVSKYLSASGTLDLGGESHGFVVCAPIFSHSKFRGLVAGVLKFDSIVKTLQPRTLGRYRIQILDQSRSVALAGSAPIDPFAPMGESTIRTLSSSWTLRMSPNAKTLESWSSSLPLVILLCGFLTSILVGYLIVTINRAKEATVREEEAKRFLESLSEASTVVTYLIDIPTREITYCNRCANIMLGIGDGNETDADFSSLRTLLHLATQEEADLHFRRFTELPSPEVIEFEQSIKGIDGVERWILHRESVYSRAADGTPLTILGVGHDLTENRLARETIRQSNQVLEKVISDAATGMALVSVSGAWLRVNRALCDLVGYSEEELHALSFQSLTHPEDLNNHVQFVSEMIDGDRRKFEVEKRYLTKEGKLIWILLNVSLIRDLRGEPLYFISQILDITERKTINNQLQAYAELLEKQRTELIAANSMLETMASTDSLTAVANRREFDSRLKQLSSSAHRYQTSLSVIIVDIDKFKNVNDTFGHSMGDSVLRQVGGILKEGARDSDVVARYGGEEFAIICPQTNLEAALLFAERLRSMIEASVWGCGALTASFGVASMEIDNSDIQAVLLKADSALYDSKKNGRNRVSCAAGGPAIAA